MYGSMTVLLFLTKIQWQLGHTIRPAFERKQWGGGIMGLCAFGFYKAPIPRLPPLHLATNPFSTLPKRKP
jgi:hypothetical protein